MGREKKLRILKWAIVLWIILGLLLFAVGVFPSSISGIGCIFSAISAHVTAIQQAQTGTPVMGDGLCLKEGYRFTTAGLADKLSSVENIQFRCGGSICQGESALLEVNSTSVTVKGGDVGYRSLVTCEKDVYDEYFCIITIKNREDKDLILIQGTLSIMLFEVGGLVVLVALYLIVKKRP